MELPDQITVPAVTVPTADAMRALGRRLAALLRPGDLVLLAGPLGAGKTTLVQGLGEALRVRGRVTSPTFVIARVHPSRAGGPDLVHVDAYRLGGLAEVDDLDLDLAGAVTVVEWGEGLAEGLSDGRLEITIGFAAAGARTGPPGDEPGDQPRDEPRDEPGDQWRDEPGDEPRTVRITGAGPRWAAPRAAAALARAASGEAASGEAAARDATAGRPSARPA